MDELTGFFWFFFSTPWNAFADAKTFFDFPIAFGWLLLNTFGFLICTTMFISGVAFALAQIFAILSIPVVLLLYPLLQWVQETTNLYLPYQRRRQLAEAEKRKKEEKEAKKQRDKQQKLYLEIEPISKFGKLLEDVDTSTAFYDESLLPCAKNDLELLLIKHIREQTKELPTEALKIGLMSLPAFQPNIGPEPLHTNIGAMMLADSLSLESLSISNKVFETTTNEYRKRAKQEEKRLAIAQKGSSKDEQRLQTYLEELENARRN